MLFRNASWSAVASAYRSFAGLFSAFLAVRLLGADDYGNVATLISLFAIYLSLVSSVFVILVAKLVVPAQGAAQPDRPVLLVAASAFAAMSICGILVLAIALGTLAPRVGNSGMLAQGLWKHAGSGAYILGTWTGLQILSGLNAAMVEGAGRLDLAMKSQLAGPSTVLLGLLALYALKIPLDAGSYLMLLCAGAGADALVLWLTRRAVIAVHLSPGHLPEALRRIPELLKSGGAIQFSSFMNIFLEPLNKLVLNHFAGGVAVTSYDLAMKIIWGLQGLFGAVMRIFLHLSSQGLDVIAAAYVRVMRLLVVPVLGAHAFGALLLAVAMDHWVDVARGPMVSFYGIATLSNLAMIYITPLYVSLIGHDDRWFLLKNQLRLTISNVVATLVLVPLLGLIGAAVGLCGAALYNSAAIHMRFRMLVGPLVSLRRVMAERLWSYLSAVALFMVSLLLGVSKGVSMPVFAAAVLALLLLVANEPLTRELLRRMKSQAAGRTR